MIDSKLQQWAQGLLNDLNDFSKDSKNFSGDKIPGFSIFYSPVCMNPKILVIGDNSGGKEKDKQKELPAEHDYFKYCYPIAKTMREKIFKGEPLNTALRNSVKINRVFFRTRDLEEFNSISNSTELEAHCFDIVQQIIGKLQPRLIFAESFGTFKKLSSEKDVLLKKPENEKELLLEGKYKEIKVLGINHPSTASFHKVNDEDWESVNKKLTEIIN